MWTGRFPPVMATHVSNWGNFPVVEADLRSPGGAGQMARLLADAPQAVVRGMGRSYGDASLGPYILSSLKLNKILALDADEGTVTCQAGVTLADLLEVFVPRGWFLPVSPGTKFITVGGAIAADVHGKNHHAEGSFCRHLLRMRLLLADGGEVECSRQTAPDLFETTCGGMGLTGAILDATFSLKKINTAYIREEILEARDLDHIMQLFEASTGWTYSVAWIDCLAQGKNLGRSLLMRGEHAEIPELDSKNKREAPLRLPAKRKRGVPCHLPSWILNRYSVRAFNGLYYRLNARGTRRHIVDYDTFFYPLDFLHDWNRIYGRQGFVQYQFVLPLESSREGLQTVLERIGEKGWGSFLAVLKLFGPQEGLMSFPMEGYTLALDFPVREGLLPFLDELDELVVERGGRIYLAKDARMKQETLWRGYPNTVAFVNRIERWNPDFRFRSRQSSRLGVTP